MNYRLLLLLVLVFPSTCLASRVPNDFLVTGTVLGFDKGANALTVGDGIYYLTARTQIERTDGRTGSRTDLVKGQWVGLDFVIDQGYFVVTTLWILSEEEAASKQRITREDRK
jgi:hypothetical protein